MNTKMKVLSLAVVGLFGFAGAAMAACPAGPTAWTGSFVNGSGSAISIQTPGYDSTECKLQSTLGNNGAAQAQVYDDTPANEPHYRAQFIFDAGQLSGNNGANSASIFVANPAAPFGGVLNTVKVIFSGSGGGSVSSGKRVFFRVACQGGAGSTCGSAAVPLPNQTGPNRIEIDLTVGASGTFRYWVNDAATTGITEASGVAVTLTGGNAGWVGVDRAVMGMAAPSVSYRSINTGLSAYFDQFDSRRQTFIGH